MPYSLSGNSEENDIKMELLKDEWKISGGRFTNRNLKYKHIFRIYDECWNRPEGGLYVVVSCGETSRMSKYFSKSPPLQSVMWNGSDGVATLHLLIIKKGPFNFNVKQPSFDCNM